MTEYFGKENVPYTKSWDILGTLLEMNEHTLRSKPQMYARQSKKLLDDAA